MSNFQYIGLAVFSVLVFRNTVGLITGRSGRISSTVWLAACLLGAAAIFESDTTTGVAKSLGIQRGADLLLYFAVLAGLALSVFSLARFRTLDRQLTQIVRQIAIDNAKPPMKREPTARRE